MCRTCKSYSPAKTDSIHCSELCIWKFNAACFEVDRLPTCFWLDRIERLSGFGGCCLRCKLRLVVCMYVCSVCMYVVSIVCVVSGNASCSSDTSNWSSDFTAWTKLPFVVESLHRRAIRSSPCLLQLVLARHDHP